MPYGDTGEKTRENEEKRDFNVRNRIPSVHARTEKEIHDAILFPLSSHLDLAKMDELKRPFLPPKRHV
jgi:hypothetical protein